MNVLLGLFYIVLTGYSWAGEERGDTNLNGETRNVERIEGLVIDQTMTPLGHEFYRAFVNTWREQGNSSRYNISVHERPSMRTANLLWVEYRFRKVYSGFARAGRSRALEGMGANAAQIAYQRIAEIEAETLANGRDLASDEI